MKEKSHSKGLKATSNRAEFLSLLGLGGAAFAFLPGMAYAGKENPAGGDDEKPLTNGKDALQYPRTQQSMPGRFPGKVVRVNHPGVIRETEISMEVAHQMLAAAVCSLTGEKDYRDAWRFFVKPGETIGLKVNPVAGKELATSVELTRALVVQLEASGLSRKDLIIWDRREPQLEECGFTTYNFPGIRILGTEKTDRNGGFSDADGKLYSEAMIDKEWFYWADVDGQYDAETLPWMVNGGRHSYFSRIVTRECDKIINLPILKNAGSSVTLCLKNLAYGAITNTGRLHEKLWSETSAEVCAFPPIRDKVVLNIVDGFRGCFQGGPGADPRYICNFNTLLVGSDPVAVDRVGYEIILAKRIAEGIQQKDYPKSRLFMDLAGRLGLGIADLEKILTTEINLS